MLDQLLREPETPTSEHAVTFEVQALREARELLEATNAQRARGRADVHRGQRAPAAVAAARRGRAGEARLCHCRQGLRALLRLHGHPVCQALPAARRREEAGGGGGGVLWQVRRGREDLQGDGPQGPRAAAAHQPRRLVQGGQPRAAGRRRRRHAHDGVEPDRRLLHRAPDGREGRAALRAGEERREAHRVLLAARGLRRAREAHPVAHRGLAAAQAEIGQASSWRSGMSRRPWAPSSRAATCTAAIEMCRAAPVGGGALTLAESHTYPDLQKISRSTRRTCSPGQAAARRRAVPQGQPVHGRGEAALEARRGGGHLARQDRAAREEALRDGRARGRADAQEDALERDRARRDAHGRRRRSSRS